MAPHSTDFDWEYTDEPHASRRIEILSKYPEIKKLMKPYGSPEQAGLALLVGLTHLLVGYIFFVRLFEDQTVYRVILAFTVGNALAGYLFMYLHEATHGMVFGPTRPKLNKAFGISLNMFMGYPTFAIFRKHHLVHHKYLGDSAIDSEAPTTWELSYFDSYPFIRLVWLQLNPILQTVRSLLSKNLLNIQVDRLDLLNASACILANFLIVVSLGTQAGLQMILYLTGSTFATMGIGFIGQWGMVVHTAFFRHYATLNYMGALNKYYLNFGYHNEHHDFPNVPYHLLPKIREIAKEYYEEIPELDSLSLCVLRFMHCEGLHGRVKRLIPKFHNEDEFEEITRSKPPNPA